MSKISPRSISGSSSILLDAMRLSAALTVVIDHAHNMWFPAFTHRPTEPGNVAHCAVIVFFVLSGFVIAHTTTSNNRGPVHYAQARLSRLYSIVLPALLFSAIAELIVVNIDPLLKAEFTRGASLPRYLLTASFLNEIWIFSAAPPINGPLWSLSYEFWYYAIFGLWFFRKGGWKSFLLPVAGCLIAGPKILLLMPVWLSGFVAYRLPAPKNFRPAISWLLIAVSLGIAAIAGANLMPYPLPIGHSPFFFANQFLTDWVIGIFIAIALWLLPSGKTTAVSSKGVKGFRKVADLTFSIYVLHNPLLALWRAVFGQNMYDQGQLIIALVTVLIFAVIIGLFLESQRMVWVHFFKWLLNTNKTRLIKMLPFLKPSSKI
jgi:peptidoglycan/LPS O-acetylase OafA/YrhL